MCNYDILGKNIHRRNSACGVSDAFDAVLLSYIVGKMFLSTGFSDSGRQILFVCFTAAAAGAAPGRKRGNLAPYSESMFSSLIQYAQQVRTASRRVARVTITTMLAAVRWHPSPIVDIPPMHTAFMPFFFFCAPRSMILLLFCKITPHCFSPVMEAPRGQEGRLHADWALCVPPPAVPRLLDVFSGTFSGAAAPRRHRSTRTLPFVRCPGSETIPLRLHYKLCYLQLYPRFIQKRMPPSFRRHPPPPTAVHVESPPLHLSA